MSVQAKIAVTGSSGYAGSHVIKILESKMHSVTPVDLKIDIDFADLHPSDFDVIVHFAAVSDHLSCDKDPIGALSNNILKLYNFVEKLDQKTIFIFASTAAVYGSSNSLSIESDPIKEGLSVYSQTKIIGERFLKDAENDKKRAVVLRLGTLYGHSPIMQYRTVVNGMTFAARHTGKISAINSHNFRAILSLNDLAMGIHKIIQNPTPGVFNLNSMNLSVGAIAQTIKSIELDSEIVYSNNLDAYSQFSYQLSNSKFLETFGEFRVETLEQSISNIREGMLNAK